MGINLGVVKCCIFMMFFGITKVKGPQQIYIQQCNKFIRLNGVSAKDERQNQQYKPEPKNIHVFHWLDFAARFAFLPSVFLLFRFFNGRCFAGDILPEVSEYSEMPRSRIAFDGDSSPLRILRNLLMISLFFFSALSARSLSAAFIRHLHKLRLIRRKSSV